MGRRLRARRRRRVARRGRFRLNARSLARWLPEGLAGRFALLLAAALVAANAVALALLSFERGRLDRAAWEERQLERVVALAPALEALEATLRRPVARDASTRFAQVSVDDEPFVDAGVASGRTAELARRLERALPGREAHVAEMAAVPDLLDRRRPRPPEAAGRPPDGRSRPNESTDPTDRSERSRRRRGESNLMISVALADASDGASGDVWLNVVARGPRGPKNGVQEGVFLLVLGLSLCAVLGVGLLGTRRLTRPLGAMATAARAAGRGDRSVRLSETGAREIREVATAFNDMQSRIARFDAERTRTLAAVGHDLRTPTTSLRIRAEMLDEATREPFVRTLDEMAVMANGLLAFARGERDAEARRSVDLAALVERLCAERGAACTIEHRVRVRGAPVALARAIGNLVDNALRYGKAARVRLSRGEHDGEPSAVLDVEDEGPGIASERLEAVLEPFVRGEGSRSSDTGGAGLGLSIARTVVRAHGGELALANRPGGGLRARISLPLESESTGEP